MKIYLVRHGQTLFNQQKKVQGWCDSPLTQEGIQQAIAVSKTLQSIPFEYAYSSTSERAMDTMHYILQDRDVPYAYVKELKELNFGSLEGEKESDVFTDISVYEKGFEMYGGETLPTCNQRFMTCLETIAKSHTDNVLVVAHGGVIMGTLNYLDEARFVNHMKKFGEVENCSVTILEYTDHFEIEDLADTSYRDRGAIVMKIFAMDIGGSSIKYALFDENRNKLDSGKIKTPAPNSMDDQSEYTVKDLYDVIDTIVPSDTDGIALSMPGVIDSENGIALTGGALTYIQEEPVEKVLSEKYGVPVWIGNDAKCAGSAEVGYGALKDVQDSVAIILGTGIGGCLIKDKKVHNGRRFSAGEVSCLYTNNAYPADYHGLWAFTSGIAGLLGLVQKYLETDEKYSGEQIFEMANSGNEKVLAALDEFCFYIALQLYNIQAIFDPEKFAIGGGISAQPLLIEKINEQYKKLFIPVFPLRPVEVVACEFRNDANLIGAYYQLQTKMVSAC